MIKYKKYYLSAILLIILIIISAVVLGRIKYKADTVNTAQTIPMPEYGCQNTANSKCIDFTKELSSQGITVSPPSNNLLDPIAPDTGKRFKIDTAGAITTELTMPAFDIDPATGLPNGNLVLEVSYKDIMKGSASGLYRGQYVGIFQKVDFYSDSVYKTLVYEDNPRLGIYGIADNTWKTAQVLFEKNQWQGIKSTDGKFTFKIVMPIANATNKDKHLPIKYISLTRITPESTAQYLKNQRDKNNFTEVTIEEINPIPLINNSFAAYVPPSGKQVFQHSRPKISEIINLNTKATPIELKTAQGESENFSLALWAKNDLKNVSFEFSDLVSPNGTITKDKLSAKKVVYDYKFWAKNYYGYPNKPATSITDEGAYGLMPDRVEVFDTTSIKASTSQQFWMLSSIPSNTATGTYSGNITVKIDGIKQSPVLPLNIKVIGIALSDPSSMTAIYNSPFTSNRYTSNKEQVYQDVKLHNIDSMIDNTPFGANIIQNPTNPNELIANVVDFKARLQIYEQNGLLNQNQAMNVFVSKNCRRLLSTLNTFYSDGEGRDLVIDRQTFKNVPDWNNLKKQSTWAQMSDVRVKSALTLMIKKMIEAGKAIDTVNGGVNILFSSNDETENTLWKRIEDNRILSVVKSAGGTTWATYKTETEISCPECVPCDNDELCKIKNGIPTLPILSPLIDYKVPHLEKINESSIASDKGPNFYTTFYSQIRNPIFNRFLHGLYATKSKSKIILIYAYNDSYGDPYNDFDTLPTFNPPFSYPDFVLSYPTRSPDGKVIPTMAMEGIKQGITDSKYIATLEKLINLDKTRPEATAARAYLDSKLSKINMNYSSNYNSASKILTAASSTSIKTDFQAFDEFRSKIWDYMYALNKKDEKIIPPVVVPPVILPPPIITPLAPIITPPPAPIVIPPLSQRISLTGFNYKSYSTSNDVIKIENTGNIDINTTGWQLITNKKQSYKLPNYNLIPGAEVTIHAGRAPKLRCRTRYIRYKNTQGKNRYKRTKICPARPAGHIYMGRWSKFFNRKHGSFTLKTGSGEMILEKSW